MPGIYLISVNFRTSEAIFVPKLLLSLRSHPSLAESLELSISSIMSSFATKNTFIHVDEEPWVSSNGARSTVSCPSPFVNTPSETIYTPMLSGAIDTPITTPSVVLRGLGVVDLLSAYPLSEEFAATVGGCQIPHPMLAFSPDESMHVAWVDRLEGFLSMELSSLPELVTSKRELLPIEVSGKSIPNPRFALVPDATCDRERLGHLDDFLATQLDTLEDLVMLKRYGVRIGQTVYWSEKDNCYGAKGRVAGNRVAFIAEIHPWRQRTHRS